MNKTLKDCLEHGGVVDKFFLQENGRRPYKVEGLKFQPLKKGETRDPDQFDPNEILIYVLTNSRIPKNWENWGAGREYLYLKPHLNDKLLPQDTKLPIYDGVVTGIPPGNRPDL